LFERASVALGLAVHHRVRELLALGLTFLRLLSLEEGRDGKIAEEPDLAQLRLGLVPQLPSFPVVDAFVRVADLAPQPRYLCQVLARAHRFEARLEAWRISRPVKRLKLPARETYEGVAVPQRVVHERQRVILRQRRKPERHLGEVNSHRVSVDAV